MTYYLYGDLLNVNRIHSTIPAHICPSYNDRVLISLQDDVRRNLQIEWINHAILVKVSVVE